MKTKKKPSLLARCLVPAGIIVGSSQANAGILIDDFTDTNPDGGLLVDTDVINPNMVTQTGLTGVIGGERKITVGKADVGEGSHHASGEVNTSSTGVFEFDSDATADGYAILSYGANTNLGADLSGESFFEILFLAYDVPGGAALPTTMTVDGDSHTESLTTNGGILKFDFSNFPGVDFSVVDQIDVRFDPVTGGDFDVGSITAVPEVSSNLVLCSIFLLGFGMRRR